MKKHISIEFGKRSHKSNSSGSISSYLQILEEQCGIRVDAVKIAEELIHAYQEENDNLKRENQRLRSTIKEYEQDCRSLKKKQRQEPQNTALKMSQKITNLLQTQLIYEKRNSQLERDLRDATEQNLELKRKIGKHKNRRQTYEKHDLEDLSSVMKTMQDSISKKDQQILDLIKRINYLEQTFRSHQQSPPGPTKQRQQRLKTASTYKTGLSRKFNSSIETIQSRRY